LPGIATSRRSKACKSPTGPFSRDLRWAVRESIHLITIAPATEVELSHRAWPVAVAESGHIAALSKDGRGTLLAPDHSTPSSLKVPVDASDAALSATGDLLAVAARGKLVLISTATLRPVHRLDDSIEACCFLHSGALWTVARWDEDSAAVEVREPEAWKVVARTELMDPFGNSSFMVRSHPDGEHVAILVAAGQDGQNLFWAHRDGSDIGVDRFPGIEDTRLPSFLPSGKQFLAICDGNELRRYKFPRGPLVGKMAWPFDDMENQIGDRVSCVDSDRALLESLECRLYLVDLRKMEIADEVCIRGHEPSSPW
jgi:WD40 repeat protein